MATLESSFLQLEGAPDIPGLRFRNYQGEEDLPSMLAMINACKLADHDERHQTMEDIIHTYRHLTNCDPYKDVLIAVAGDQTVAYSRVTWSQEEKTRARYYTSFGFVHPTWRRKGIGSTMLRYNQGRIREIAAGHPQDGARAFESFATSYQQGACALLEQDGYSIARRFYFMVRPDLENIPDLPLPTGLEVRPVRPDQYRQVWDAFQDAFRDHWGYSEPQEADYEGWLGSSDFQPDLWQVAWDGDEVAGFILNFINHGENEEYGRKRGFTEGIGVRRPWRRRGLARALLARSLAMHRDLGMREAALGVDTESLSGANLLYESIGFRTMHVMSTYRKDF